MPPRDIEIRARKRRRRLALLALFVGVVLALPVVLTRSPLVRLVLLPRLSERLDADVTARRIVIDPDATIVASDVLISIPGLDGAAGEVLRVDRVEIESSWGRLLTGDARADRVRLVRPHLRASRDRGDGSFNLARLRFESADTGPSDALPRVLVEGGVVEFGEHLGSDYETLRSLRVQGAVTPTVDPQTLGYQIDFAEGAVSDLAGGGVTLRGRLAPTGVTLTLEGLVLADWQPEHVPRQYRELFALMQISGAIPRSAMSIGADGSAAFRVELEGVSLNLPFDAEGGQPASAAEMVRLREVTGTIEVDDAGARATLASLLGDLPALVRLDYRGLATDSAFSCEITTEGFELSANPELLPLAPGIVVRRLADFSNPTATVNAHIFVERGPPIGGAPAPMSVEGELAFKNGSAAFEGFPYRFNDMTGLARFDSEKIEILGVTGVAPSGAALHATGRIAPPLPGAAVDLNVRVTGVPIDDMLLRTMGDRRRSIVEALFNADRYRQLVERGVVRGPGGGAGRAFEFGGEADIEVHILRELGEHTDYTRTIRVTLAEAGAVPEPFPLPIVARDVVIEIDEVEARVVGGTFRGLSGGEATVSATVDLEQEEGFGLRMLVDATGVPADELLIAALPGGLDAEPERDSPASVLRRVGVRGAIDCTAGVEPLESGDLDYRVTVTFDDMVAHPEHAPGSPARPVFLAGVSGEAVVTSDLLTIDFAGGLVPVGAESEAGRIEVSARLGLGDDAHRPVSVDLVTTLDDVGLAVEDLLAVVSPDSAERVIGLRERLLATGGLTARVRAAGDLTLDPPLETVDVTLTDCRALAFDAADERFVVDATSGSVEFSALGTDTLRFDGFAGALAVEGEAPAEIEASGRFPLGRQWLEEDVLGLVVRGARFESRLVRRALRDALPERLRRAADEAEVTSLADARLRIAGQRAPEARPLVTGLVEPRSLEAVVAGQRVTAHEMAGGITLDATGGAFQGCRLVAEGWWAEIDGSWVTTGSGGALFDCRLDAESSVGLRPDVLALLPEGLRSVLESMQVETDSRVSASGVDLRLTTGEGGVSGFRSSGRVEFEGVRARVGVGVEGASGYLDFESESVPGAELPNFGVGIIADHLVAAGVTLRDAAVRVASSPASGVVLVPVIVADSHGGRLTGSATIQTRGTGRPRYEAEIAMSRVPLGELLADWSGAHGVATEDAPARSAAEERGFVNAGVTLSGSLGEGPNDRRGRGTIQVGGGQVIRLPLLLPLIQVSNLQLPDNARLDFGETVFYLEGDRVVFERASVFAENLEIFGYGQMDLPDLTLDMRFKSRAVRRLILVNQIVEAFRDELITTRVAGTLARPEVSLEQFARTRRFISGALGTGLSEQDRRMLEIERLSREAVARERRSERPAASPPGG